MNLKTAAGYLILVIFSILILIVFPVFILGVFSIDYSIGMAIGKAILIGILFVLCLSVIKNIINKLPGVSSRKGLQTVFSAVLISGCFMSVACMLLINVIGLNGYIAHPGPCFISYYRMIIKPETADLDGFVAQQYISLNTDALLEEHINFNPPSTWIPIDLDGLTGFRLPDSKAIINIHGFLVKEAMINFFVFNDPNLDTIFNLSPSCEKAEVRLQDMPLNTFIAVEGVSQLNRAPYLDTETIEWSAHIYQDQSVKFGYLPTRFRVLRSVLTPLLGVSSLGEWLAGVLATLTTMIMGLIIQPTLIDFGKKVFNRKLEKPVINTTETSDQIRKLIVSPDGKEKEIKIKKE